jgi:4-alpha-glucanotransferase
MHHVTLPTRKQAGVCLHLASLPGEYGIGEIGAEARRFIDALTVMQQKVWQFLPVGPTGYGNSPYQPLSTFAGNELLIDIANLIELELVQPREAQLLQNLPLDYVDYAQLIPLKNHILASTAANFSQRASAQLKAELNRFNAANNSPWLHDYALYRVLKARHGERSWLDWAPEFAHRDPSALRDVEANCGPQLNQVRILQFLFARQWAELHRYAASRGILLFGDLPIYIAMDSADAWAHPELLLTDKTGEPAAVAGVPPDYFSADGQLWGNPLYDWSYHASTGFTWWVARLRHACSMANLVRIDHFRGFESYWAVPADAANARTGRWEQGPGDALFDAVRAALGDLPIVAEDLGIITAAVDQLRDRQGIPGMRVLQFDIAAEEFSPEAIPENCVCYTGTHDNDTTVGWFNGSDGSIQSAENLGLMQQRVLEYTGGSAATIHTDLIRLAFDSPARLAIAPMQDYLGLGSLARLNQPGTASNNWRWRLLSGQLTPAVLDSIGAMTTRAGRNVTGT